MKFIISIGTNLCHVEALLNLNKAEILLNDLFHGDAKFSHYYETEGVGSGVGKKYYNEVAIGETDLSYIEIRNKLKQIESDLGRTIETKKQGIVPIDLDLIKLGDIIYKVKDLEQEYVKIGLEMLGV
mgnify:CR=1 FL=1